MTSTDDLIIETCTNIAAASEPLIGNRLPQGDSQRVADDDELKSKVQQASNVLKTEVAKCAIMAPELSDAASLAPLLKSTEQAAISLCAACYTILEHAGPSLSSLVAAQACKACRFTEDFLQVTFVRHKHGEEVKSAVGKVFEICQALQTASLTNKQAVGREFLQVAMQLKDVTREMTELMEENRRHDDDATSNHYSTVSERAQSEALGEEDELEAEDFDFDAMPLTLLEVDVAASARSFANDFDLLLKAIIRQIHSLPGSAVNDSLDTWERALVKCKTISITLNDLGAGLYGPQDREELLGLMEQFQTQIDDLKTDSVGDSALTCNVVPFSQSAELLEQAVSRLKIV